MRLPKIAVWSLFRDAAGEQITNYRRQIDAFNYPAKNIRLYLGEGDSKDTTLAELKSWAQSDSRVRIIKHDTGEPYRGHTIDPSRMAVLASTGNAVWDAIAADGWADYALMLESDLIVEPDLISRLLNSQPEADIVAPMIWLKRNNNIRFYDIWAFRRSNVYFPPNSPAWYAANYPNKPFRVDSAGSVLLIKAEALAVGVRFSKTEAVVGMCNQARDLGFTVYCDPEIHVVHPDG